MHFQSKIITHGAVQPEYWNIPPKYWGAILRTNIPQGLSGVSMVCQYHVFLSLFTSLPRIMLILGGPNGISDSVRETMRKVLDAWLNYELARQPCLKIGTNYLLEVPSCVLDLGTFTWLFVGHFKVTGNVCKRFFGMLLDFFSLVASEKAHRLLQPDGIKWMDMFWNLLYISLMIS